MNATQEALESPSRPISQNLPSSPPPPVDVDITEPLRWAASVANFVGHPDLIEFSARERHIQVTLRDETMMMLWSQTIGATSTSRIPDALGVMGWARTTDETRWLVTLCAVVRNGGQ